MVSIVGDSCPTERARRFTEECESPTQFRWKFRRPVATVERDEKVSAAFGAVVCRLNLGRAGGPECFESSGVVFGASWGNVVPRDPERADLAGTKRESAKQNL